MTGQCQANQRIENNRNVSLSGTKKCDRLTKKSYKSKAELEIRFTYAVYIGNEIT